MPTVGHLGQGLGYLAKGLLMGTDDIAGDHSFPPPLLGGGGRPRRIRGEQLGNKIGRITPDGTITEFSTGLSPGCSLWGITAGPDGNLWFAEQAGDRIGRITPDGTITEFPPQPLPEWSQPINIATGPDGNLWFTELGANKIGRITTDGTITEFPIPTPSRTPWGIAAGRGNKVWFTEASSEANSIGRINVK